MASKEQLRKIPIYCEEYYCKIHDDEVSLKNMIDVEYKSCTNCIHFTNKHSCELDLIDKILSSMAMEQDLKS